MNHKDSDLIGQIFKDSSSQEEKYLRDLASSFLRSVPRDRTRHSENYMSLSLALEAKYRNLVEQIPAVTFSASFSEGLRDVYVSPQIEAVLGYTQKEWVENPILWYQRLHPDDKGRWNHEFAETVLWGKPFNAIYRFLSKDDRVIWLHGAASIVRDDNGSPLFIQGIGFDITEVKEAQANIEAAELRFRTIFNTASDFIATFTPNGVFTSINPAFQTICGFAPEDWMGQSMAPLIHPHDLKKVFDSFAGFESDSSNDQTSEIRILTAEGSYKVLEAVFRPIYEAGRLTGFFCVARDITARKELDSERDKIRKTLERQVKEKTSELRIYRDLVESSNEAIITISLDDRISAWNQRAEEVFGFTKDEVINQNVASLLPDMKNDLETIKSGSRIKNIYDTKFLRRNGSEINIDLSMFPILDEEGNLSAISIIAIDITDRKRLEERFRLAIEAAPTGMIMVDASGIIQMTNQQTMHIFGYTDQDLVGQSIEVLVPMRFSNRHSYYREAFVKNPVARPMGKGRDLFGRRKDGTEVPVEIGLNPIETPEGTYILSSINDITERKKAEAAIKQKNKQLERTNEEMEQMIHTISHDLKSPIVTITSFLGFLEEDVKEGNAEGINESIEYIHRAAAKMSILIKDLLELSRLGYLEMDIKELDVKSIIEEALEALHDRLAAKGFQLALPEQSLMIKGDRKRILQVFDNLINNAIKYASDSPDPKLSFEIRKEQNETLVCVRDNGPGIEKQYHHKIFKIFQRLDQEKEGTGVGLSIVAKVMKLHGGRAWVESEPEHGAAFWLAFPDE